MAAAKQPANLPITAGDDRPVAVPWVAFFDDMFKRTVSLEAGVSWRSISTTVLSAATATTIFALPSAYRRFRIEFQDVTPTVAAYFYLRWSVNGGSSYLSGVSDYTYAMLEMGPSTVASSGASTSYAALSGPIVAAAPIGGALEFSSTGGKFCNFDLTQFSAVRGWERTSGSHVCANTTTATHIQLGMTATTMSAGRFKLLGASL